jgi:anti-anti-sigma factor
MYQIAQGLELEVERGPDWLYVRPRFTDGATIDETDLAEEIWHLLEQHFTRRLVLELDRLVHLDSQMLGQMIRLYKRISAEGGLLRICGLSVANQDLLDQCHLSGRLPCYSNRADAVMGFRPAQPR